MSDDARLSPTPRYSRVVDASAGVARETGHSYIGVEHLFLAMIRNRSAVPTQVLARTMDLDQVEASLLDVMASPGYQGEPPADAVWFPRSELAGRPAALCSAGGYDS
jgi:ATP-dependent Clp protease ATP-binding subunit ClpA